MTLHFSTGASEDLVQHLTYLGEQSKQAQLDFYNELNGALELISGYPEISPKVRGGIHRFTILRFSIGVYYTVGPEKLVTIISLLHLKSNPDKINERITK